jgi:hypothetical protein
MQADASNSASHVTLDVNPTIAKTELPLLP